MVCSHFTLAEVLDSQLHEDPIALNLLYIETISDIKKGWIEVPDDVADDLANYRAQKDRKAFLATASRLKGYGCTQFGEATSTFPQENSTADCSLGNGAFTIEAKETGKVYNFKVSSMRCWRTSTVSDNVVELEFEYFFPPQGDQKEGRMSWVKIVSSQTIHIAMCLQFLVEEMLRLRKRKPIRRPADRVNAFKPRRQKKKVDLNFLTDEAAAARADEEYKPVGSVLSLANAIGIIGPNVKVSVTLSELKKRVKADAEESQHSSADEIAAMYRSPNAESDGQVPDPDDYDSDDDDKAAFASMAGL